MLNGIYTSGLGAKSQSHKMEIIANNLANVNTPGFRRDHISFRERLAEALEDIPQDFRHYNMLVHRYGGAPLISAVEYDLQPGAVVSTGNPLDLAIDGKGFFRVRDLTTGREFYTRAGNFSRGANGLLTTADGKYAVVNTAGDVILFNPIGSPTVAINENGEIFQGDEFIGRIGVMEFDDDRALRKVGDNAFENTGAPPAPSFSSKIRQGVLEGSSVNTIIELTEMIKANRAIESNLSMMRIQDGTLDRLINDVGRIR